MRLGLKKPYLAPATAVVAAGVALSLVSASSAGATAPQSARATGSKSAGIPKVTVKPVPLAKRNPKLPDVVVVDAGGTITSTAADRISYLHYGPALAGGIKDVLDPLYPELGKVANVSVVRTDVTGSSSQTTTKNMYDLSRAVDASLALPGIDGVVVNSGTNVLEEDAYYLDLTVQSNKPVVISGSMHQSRTFTTDGATNMFSSIRLAASGKTTCYGTVMLMNDQFFAAREVTKTDGYRMDTFGGGNYGALGVVNEDNIRTMRAPARVMQCGKTSWKTPFNLSKKKATDLPPVDVVSGYIESSPVPIDALVAAGAKGVVTSGHGPGGISAAQRAAETRAIAKGVVFVSATRTGGEGTYDTGTPGVIGAADLAPQKARVLLQLGLAFSGKEKQIRTWFTTIGDPEFDLSAFRR
ncbi:asparaginase [Streptomyces sp. NPDC020951]|uniref:asparaginase n=1 Tax=Streptomyces sp. NPDC020951 TaxID=3365104 RepID=UPI0037B1AD8B